MTDGYVHSEDGDGLHGPLSPVAKLLWPPACLQEPVQEERDSRKGRAGACCSCSLLLPLPSPLILLLTNLP